jgi:hypothetical protein
MTMPTNSDVFLVSRRLRDLLEEVLIAGLPEDYSSVDDQAIGVVLNDWRIVLARFHAVHNSAGRHTGWGSNLEDQVTRLIAWHQAREAKLAQAAQGGAEEIEIPGDDEEAPETEPVNAGSPSPRQRKRT